MAERMAGSVGLDLRLVACDWQTRLAEIDTYQQATIVERFNEVSTYELQLPADTDAAQVLLQSARPRIVAIDERTGLVFRSGPVTRFERSSGDAGEQLTLYGVDDLVWLRRRIVHPQPASAAPPYATTAYDTRTGAASTVLAGYVDRNAGPAATTARQVPGLTVPAPAAFGPTVTLSGRYQNLLEFVRLAARAAGVGIRVRDLVFQVYQPASEAVFSADLGTLAGWRATSEAPETNYVYVAGAGEGTARLIREYSDAATIPSWGRSETFQDRRDTSATAELDQSGAETLADGARPPAVELDVLDTAAQQFLRDWNVGDRATVRVGGVTITDVIAEATISLEPNRYATVRPIIGAAGVSLDQWRQLAQANRRIRQLERT
jgi:hypothetical protein